MKRIMWVVLCLVLVMASSCDLFNSYKEMSPSSLGSSGGTAPADEAAALGFVNDFLGITLTANVAKYMSGGKTTDLQAAFKAYLLSKAGGTTKATDELIRHSTINANLGYNGPVDDGTGTADVTGKLSGTIPFDFLIDNYAKLTTPNHTYEDVAHFLLTLVLNGEMNTIEMGDYTLVQAKLKNEGDGKVYLTLATDGSTPMNVDVTAASAELKLKMSNGFSLKHTDGTGVKFTIFADVDAKTTADITDNASLLEFLDQIKFTINVYNDANTLIGSETISLTDLLS
ncbi:MAG: hypothetical protein LLF89_06890 [Spirochaetaceae bacterium]|nr:hypothetical protein [Spirochaetaceae bacterium]